MQKAMENFIDIQSKLGKSLDKIEDEIDKVEKYVVRRARKEQFIKWRKLNKRS